MSLPLVQQLNGLNNNGEAAANNLQKAYPISFQLRRNIQTIMNINDISELKIVKEYHNNEITKIRKLSAQSVKYDSVVEAYSNNEKEQLCCYYFADRKIQKIELDDKIKRLSNDLGAAKSEIENNLKLIEELRFLVSDRDQIIRDIEEKFNETEALRTSIEEKNTALLKEISRIRHLNIEVESRLNLANRANKELNGRLDNLKCENDYLASEVEISADKIEVSKQLQSELQEKISRLEKSEDSSTRQILYLTDANIKLMEEAVVEKNKLDNQKQEYDMKLSQEKIAYACKVEELKESGRQKSQLEEQVRKLQHLFDQEKRAHEETARQLEAQKIQVEQEKTNHLQTSTVLEEKKRKVDQLTEVVLNVVKLVKLTYLSDD